MMNDIDFTETDFLGFIGLSFKDELLWQFNDIKIMLAEQNRKIDEIYKLLEKMANER